MYPHSPQLAPTRPHHKIKYRPLRSPASKSVRFASFPRVLVVHMRRYYVDSDWTAKKLSVHYYTTILSTLYYCTAIL